MDLNTVALSGNLTRDPELRQTTGGKDVVSLRVAAKTFGDKSVFVDVTAWEKLAVIMADAFKKGSKIALTGRLDYREWETTDGSKRNALSIVALDVVFPPRVTTDAADDIDF